MIVIPVDDNLEIIGVEIIVAAHKARCNSRWTSGVEHRRTDVQRIFVVQNADHRFLRGRFAFIRIELRELRNRFGGTPRRIVKLAIENDG